MKKKIDKHISEGIDTTRKPHCKGMTQMRDPFLE